MTVQSRIDIPAPLDADPDTVVTALETAAVFASKGDGAEALRWLKRAADSAGEGSDDARTLTLARSAADLSRQLQEAAAPAKASASPLPPAASPSPSPPPLPSQPAATTQSVPAPASGQKWLPRPPPRAPSVLPSEEGALARPPAPSSRPASSPQASNGPISQVPLSSSGATATPSVRGSLGRATARVPRLESRSPEPPRAEVKSVPRVDEPVADTSGQFRRAARVSVVASPSERGLFLVRLLDEGAALPPEATEGLLVVMDPKSTMLSVDK